MSDDNTGDDEEERRAGIPTDVKARIAKADWKFGEYRNELLIPQAGKKDRLDLLEDLKAAGINYKIDITGYWLNQKRNIVVKVYDLDKLVPEWRDVSYPEDIMHALATAGWRISKKSPDTAQVIIEGRDELRALAQNLDVALIPYQVGPKAKSGGGPPVVSVKVTDLDFLIPKWRTAAVPEEVKQELLGAGWQFSPGDEHAAFVTITHPDELKALTALLDEANILYVISQGQGAVSSQHLVTVKVENLDRLLGNEWREAANTPEVRDYIAKAGWVVEQDIARFTSNDEKEVAELRARLHSAGIKFGYGTSYLPTYQQTININVDVLDQAIPGWRDASEAKALEDATRILKMDTEVRAGAGRSWHEGDAPKDAIMVCKGKEDAKALVDLLTEAHISARREGADGKIVVTSADALRGVGIDVKTVESEVESEEQKQEAARKWLKTQVIWKMASEVSPLARAVFTKGGDVSNALESLLGLKCTAGLKRLSRETLMKDNSGLMLEVNADALKAAVPGVAIAPFNHAQSTDREEDERRTGR